MTRPPTVFVTGGSSGIGLGLAAAFLARGATVVIGGRDEASLAAAAARYPGLQTETVDVADAASVAACVGRLEQRHSGLDTLINNAGIQRLLDFSAGEPPAPAAIDEEIDINLKGLIRVSAALLPLLRRQPRARLVHVGSGLAFAPLAAAPVYSATKAAVHSFTVSLRRQLAGSSVQVVEIIPPVVATGLHRHQPRPPPGAMPLATFVRTAMAGLDAGRDEITVGLARLLRVGSRVSPALFTAIVNKPRG